MIKLIIRPAGFVLFSALFILGSAVAMPGLSCEDAAFYQAKADDSDTLKTAETLSYAFAEAAKIITPSIVNISAVKRARVARGLRQMPDPFFDQFRDFFGPDFFDRFTPFRNPEGFSQQGLGTGVIVDDKGHILTNNHVIGDADEVTVRFPGDKTYKAEIVGSDPRTDLAVIRIKAEDLVPAKLGNSDELKTGQWVVAAGNPFGLENTITAGIVSAKGRSIMGGGQYEDFIQTDAAINPGNSGGPLVNLKGEVVGINTAIFSRSGGYMGIGFAIPINMARSVMDSLISKGKVVRGWLGVGIQNLSEDLAKSFAFEGTEGALVGHLEKGGPAESAGVKQGDIIVKLDGERIRNINQLRNSVAALAPGKKIDLEVMRDGRRQTLRVKVGELPAQEVREQTEEDSAGDLGMRVENLTPDLARQLGVREGSGVVVRSVLPGSPAARAGVQRGDIIVSINGKPVKSIGEFNQALGHADIKKGIRLVLQSEGMERFAFLKTD